MHARHATVAITRSKWSDCATRGIASPNDPRSTFPNGLERNTELVDSDIVSGSECLWVMGRV